MVHSLLLLTQAVLSAVIVGAIYGLYRQVDVEDVKLRLRFFLASFLALLASLIFHTFSLLWEHVFGIVFFLLLGATGLLHFTERRYHGAVVKAGNILVALLLAGGVAVQVLSSTVGVGPIPGVRAIILAHGFQVAVLVLVTGLILRRILILHPSPSLTILLRRYPFGMAAMLMMFAVAAHIVNVSVRSTHATSLFESFFLLPALLIVAGYVLFAYKRDVYLFGYGGAGEGVGEERRPGSLLEHLNHVIRQVYYTPVDIGTGRREVLFNEFLESTGVGDVFKRREMELDREKFALVSDEFLYRLSENILRFFLTYRELMNEAQFYHLVNFLNSAYARLGQSFDFKPHWLMLSELAKILGTAAERHLEKLSGWDNETTFSYFEELHPTGIQEVDERFSGAGTHQLILNVLSGVAKLRVLHPVIKSALHSWRNVVYVASEPVAKIRRELSGEWRYCGKRLRVVTFLPDGGKREECVLAVSSPQDIIKAVEECISAFPLSTVILVIDLTPIVISLQPAQLHALVKRLDELRYSRRVAVCAAVSKNIPPLAMDILQEDADVVVEHSLVSGAHVSRILKPEPGTGEAPLSTELFEVLQFVYTQNARGRRPAMKEVSSALSITPKTAKKRLRILESRGMLRVEKQGRYRVAEVTERGRRLVLSGG
jgi:hypothetical protein